MKLYRFVKCFIPLVCGWNQVVSSFGWNQVVLGLVSTKWNQPQKRLDQSSHARMLQLVSLSLKCTWLNGSQWPMSWLEWEQQILSFLRRVECHLFCCLIFVLFFSPPLVWHTRPNLYCVSPLFLWQPRKALRPLTLFQKNLPWLRRQWRKSQKPSLKNTSTSMTWR